MVFWVIYPFSLFDFCKISLGAEILKEDNTFYKYLFINAILYMIYLPHDYVDKIIVYLP